MPSASQLEAMNVYADIMEEIKIRISAIQSATSGTFRLISPLVREFCFLQLRMICELIALGCLVVHGDISAAKPLIKEYSAGRIISKLEELHSDFYPHPEKHVRKEPNEIHLEVIETGFLTRDDLVNLYNNKCGQILHRGNLKKLMSKETPVEFEFSDIVSWVNKMQVLLSSHRIALLNGETHFLCVLRNIQDGDRVQVAIAEPRKPE